MRLRLERRDLRARWHLRPYRYQASCADPRPESRTGTSEPRTTGLRHRRRNAGPYRVRYQPLDCAAQPRLLSASPRWHIRAISGRPGPPEIGSRSSDRLRQCTGLKPLPRRTRAEANRHPHAQLQPPCRPRLLRQRPAVGLHRVEGSLQEHPRGLRQQPVRLHGRERHRPRLPS